MDQISTCSCRFHATTKFHKHLLKSGNTSSKKETYTEKAVPCGEGPQCDIPMDLTCQRDENHFVVSDAKIIASEVKKYLCDVLGRKFHTRLHRTRLLVPNTESWESATLTSLRRNKHQAHFSRVCSAARCVFCNFVTMPLTSSILPSKTAARFFRIAS